METKDTAPVHAKAPYKMQKGAETCPTCANKLGYIQPSGFAPGKETMRGDCDPCRKTVYFDYHVPPVLRAEGLPTLEEMPDPTPSDPFTLIDAREVRPGVRVAATYKEAKAEAWHPVGGVYLGMAHVALFCSDGLSIRQCLPSLVYRAKTL